MSPCAGNTTTSRRGHRAWKPFVAVVFVTLSCLPALGATVDGESEPVDIKADSLSVTDSGRKVEAKGNVELRREDAFLRADEIRVDRETQDVEAKGRVSLEDPRGTLRADAIRLNLEQETAEIENGDLFFAERQLSVTGKRLQKLPGQVYHAEETFFTTCLCESGIPSWKIAASQVDLTREGTGVVRGATFYIRNIPVFYLPYAIFPLRTERHTGFLFPKIGSSSREGFRFRQPFFWVLSKSSDATVVLDLQTRARVGFLGELRNVWSREAHGQMNLAYYNENLRKNPEKDIRNPTIADPEIPRDRWNVFVTHRQAAPLGWKTYSDVMVFSDDLFARELSDRLELSGVDEFSLKRSRYARSRLGLFKSWDSAFFRGEGHFYQDFIQPDAGTLHRVPQVSFWGRLPVGETPMEIRWHGEGVNYVRREGEDGLRMDLRPELLFPFRLPAHLSGSWSVAPRGTFYHLYETSGSGRRNLFRETVEVRGALGTSLDRVFHWNGTGAERIKHIVEPELSYLFIPAVEQRDIPIMDGVDRIRRRNVLTFALNQRFWGRSAPPASPVPEEEGVEVLNAPVGGDIRSLGEARLALSYDVDKERKGGDSLSDLDVFLRASPLPYLTLGLDAGLDPGPWKFTRAAPIVAIVDPRPITRRVLDPDFMRPNSFSLSYRFLRPGPNAFLAEDANVNLDAPPDCVNHPLDPRCSGFHGKVLSDLGWNIFYHVSDHILFRLNSNINTRDASIVQSSAAIKLLSQCECWTVTFSFNRGTNPSRTSFSVTFNLLGLGSGSDRPL